MDNVLIQVVIPLVSALIGGGFSLWIFQLGLKGQDQRKKLEKITSDFEIEEYVNANIKSLAYFIDEQIYLVGHTSQLSKNWLSKNLTLMIRPELKLNELRELHFNDLFKIFVLKRKGTTSNKSRDFINFKNSLHQVERYIDIQLTLNEETAIKIQNNLERWNDAILGLLSEYNKLAINLPFDINDNFMSVLHNHFVLKQRELILSGDDQDMSIYFKEIILPVEIFITDKNKKNEKRASHFITYIIECKRAFLEAQSIRYYRRLKLINSGRELIYAKQQMTESFSSLCERDKY